MHTATIRGREYTGTGPLDIATQAYGEGLDVLADAEVDGRYMVIESERSPYGNHAVVARIMVYKDDR